MNNRIVCLPLRVVEVGWDGDNNVLNCLPLWRTGRKQESREGWLQHLGAKRHWLRETTLQGELASSGHAARTRYASAVSLILVSTIADTSYEHATQGARARSHSDEARGGRV